MGSHISVLLFSQGVCRLASQEFQEDVENEPKETVLRLLFASSLFESLTSRQDTRQKRSTRSKAGLREQGIV